ncbi:hypothetical protein I3843_05G189300 [Carya illinoinensis]|uniref:DNA polymerase delta subunit 4 n=1 Tax=Carya illinoinensis TaxID=32201 RepID=A0A8T1QMP8_CARIL|nr:DNA polymerase delta subunit 4 [Carya illinoinensis]KAG2708779.1 hypothetical protein I3760_05G208700 [Carya illinoinensis]KAG6655364.1 hypothetical protein CIPAW_05G211300 [Carya illinoinensis]KAG6714504.1 hypothetical protein I3842_05G205600 [Carya illinoinensis]KAG7980581.1 hypothetical protein I3843_05G189300 [Carya illinoinensis]
MAARSENMKGFYRQRKKSGVTKKPLQPSSSSNKSPKHSPTFGSDVTHAPALLSHGSPDLKDEYDESEEVLRQFDLNMAYGPCLGMTRQARWERARRLGLNPPYEIERLLKAGKVEPQCLWDGRV